MLNLKKLGIFTAFLVATAFLFVHKAAAVTTDPVNSPDIWCVGAIDYGISGTTIPICVDVNGNIIPARHAYYNIGKPTHHFGKGYFSDLNASSGIINVHETFTDLSSGAVNGLNTAGLSISSANLTLQSSTYYVNEASMAQSTGAPRNLVVYSSVTSVGVTTHTLVGTVTFYGINNLGQSVSEGISFSTALPRFSTAAITRLPGVGNVAWSTISSFTIQLTSISLLGGLADGSENVIIRIGFGVKIGLSNNIDAFGDIYKVIEQGNDTTSTTATVSNVDTVYDTVFFPTALIHTTRRSVRYKSSGRVPK